MLCHFSYNPTMTDKPPVISVPAVSRGMWRRINGGFRPRRGTPRMLARLVQEGHPYTAVHNGYRHERYFVLGQTPSMDFDTGDERSSFGALLEDDFIRENATFLYTTPSHTEGNPRARVVFILDRPIRAPRLYAAIARGMVMHYQMSDPSCKDASRIFFGSAGCKIQWLGNRPDIHAFSDMIEAVLKQDEEEMERLRSRVIESVSDATVMSEVHRHLRTVSNAPDGERHITRLRIAKLFGGMVAAGYISREEATQALLNAALTNTDSPHELVERDIVDGLRSGLGSPVALRRQSFADWGVDLPW